jgi:hypothetical protein
LPAALNTGFSQANGIYFTWTSDDNLYRPKALELMVDYLESHATIDIVYTDYTEVDEQGRMLRMTSAAQPERLGHGNCVGTSFLYRRLVHEALGGYAEDFFLAEDYDFWLRASAMFRLAPLHHDLYLYRQHGLSLTALQRERVAMATERVFLRNLPRLFWMTPELSADAYRNLAAEAMWRGDQRRAYRHLFCAMACAPGFVVRDTPRRSLVALVLGPRRSKMLKGLYNGLRNASSHLNLIGR